MNEAHDAILHLMHEYCYRIDAGNIKGFAKLFEHGTWRVIGDSNGGDTGQEAVLETLQNVILYNGKPNTKHVMGKVEIGVDESS